MLAKNSIMTNDQQRSTNRHSTFFWPLFMAGIVAQLIFIPGRGLQAQQKVFIDKLKTVSFRYSDQLQTTPAPHADVLVADVLVTLRSKESGFPSFNIVSIAQKFIPEALGNKQYQEQILADYRKVGYTEATVIQTFAVTIANQSAYTAQLSYPSTAGKLISLVTLLPNGPDSHLVLTYIDYEASFSMNRPSYEEIVDSMSLLKINNTNQLQATMKESDRYPTYWTTFAILALLGVATGLATLMRRAKSGTP